MENNRFSPLSLPSATRAVLERYGLFTKYALGQNFLVNDNVIRKIVQLSELCSTDHILEVGPGIGTLTSAMLPLVKQVTAIEKDTTLLAVLADTLAPWSDCCTLIAGDALNMQVASNSFQSCNKMVSNLPYAVAATVVLAYLKRFDNLESMTVMVQKEVADRIMGSPGTKTYGSYTVKLSMFAQPAGRFMVSPGSFFPPPHVESTVLRLNRITPPVYADEVCVMADAAFATRRKTLINSCKTYFASNSEILAKLPDIFEQAGIDSRCRGETLTRDEFIALGTALAQC